MYTVSLFKKTCRDHCQIFVHHSPQEGNLGGWVWHTCWKPCCWHLRMLWWWLTLPFGLPVVFILPNIEIQTVGHILWRGMKQGAKSFCVFPSCWQPGERVALWRLEESSVSLCVGLCGEGELRLTHKGGWSSVSLHCNPQLPESLQIPPHTTLQTIPSPKLLK